MCAGRFRYSQVDWQEYSQGRYSVYKEWLKYLRLLLHVYIIFTWLLSLFSFSSFIAFTHESVHIYLCSRVRRRWLNEERRCLDYGIINKDTPSKVNELIDVKIRKKKFISFFSLLFVLFISFLLSSSS